MRFDLEINRLTHGFEKIMSMFGGSRHIHLQNLLGSHAVEALASVIMQIAVPKLLQRCKVLPRSVQCASTPELSEEAE